MRAFVIGLLLVTTLAACGIRPKTLPPEGMEQKGDTFPRTYPDLSTDPR